MRIMKMYDTDIKENVFVIQESDPYTHIVQLAYTGPTKGTGHKYLTLNLTNLVGTVKVHLFVDNIRIDTQKVTNNSGIGTVTAIFQHDFVDEDEHQLLFRVDSNDFCGGNKLLVYYQAKPIIIDEYIISPTYEGTPDVAIGKTDSLTANECVIVDNNRVYYDEEIRVTGDSTEEEKDDKVLVVDKYDEKIDVYIGDEYI
ncbi:MAG: hypothetical protein HUJ56_03645, partial [Erysipelotrichaceae bacterium]|nr:hypothetical protein [Erysipelotrichaceae bacterium]